MLDGDVACDAFVEVDVGNVVDFGECRERQAVRRVWVLDSYSFRQCFLLLNYSNWVFA